MRISQKDMQERMEFVYNLFKENNELSAAKANDRLKEKYGHAMNLQKVYEIRKRVEQNQPLAAAAAASNKSGSGNEGGNNNAAGGGGDGGGSPPPSDNGGQQAAGNTGGTAKKRTNTTTRRNKLAPAKKKGAQKKGNTRGNTTRRNNTSTQEAQSVPAIPLVSGEEEKDALDRVHAVLKSIGARNIQVSYDLHKDVSLTPVAQA